MGARLTRGSSLSDARVIEFINANFVPLELNLSKSGFPIELPGLRPWATAYEKNWRYKSAFATTVVLDSSGRHPLGTSGSGHRDEFATSTNYHPDKYLRFLSSSTERVKRYNSLTTDGTLRWPEKMRQLASLRNEVTKSIRDANQNAGRFRATSKMSTR